MTRIFDALKKSGARRSPPPSPDVATLPATALAAPMASHGPVAIVRRPGEKWGVQSLAQAGPMLHVLRLTPDAERQLTSLRVALESTLTDEGGRVVMFQSSQRGEGASTVAMQFADLLSRDARLRVLLVDLNAGHPTLQRDATRKGILMLSPEDYDATAVDTAELHALAIAAQSADTGTVGRDKVRDVIEAAAQAYDWVVLDGPPVLDSVDAVALSALAHGVVVTIQAGRTKRPVLSRSVDLLQKAGARVLGSVLNRRRLEIPDFIYQRI